MKPFCFFRRPLRACLRVLLAGGLVGPFFTAFASPAFASPPLIVTSVIVPANGTYIAGQSLDFTVNWSQVVTVNVGGGTPYLTLTLATGTVDATYLSGSGTTVLVFQYVVAPGDEALTGVALGSAITLNGGTIQDVSAAPAALTLNSIASTSGVDVDATAPTVESIQATDPSPTNATVLTYDVNFSEPIDVTPGTDFTADFAVLTSGTVTAGSFVVTAVGGSTFVATIGAVTGNGTLSIELVGDSGIFDDVGNQLVGTYSGSDVYTIDKTPPVVTSVAVPANATYIAGQDLDFTVTTSESVTVDTTGGTPFLPVTLAVGGTVDAQYLSGSGTNALTFRYVVVPGNEDLSGISLGSSINLNGGVIEDAATNNVVPTLAGVASTTGVLVDAIAPSVLSIDTVQPSTNNLSSDEFAVTFSEPVTGVVASDFAVATTGTASASVTSVTGSGAAYTVTIGSVTGVGTMQLDLNSSGTGIADLATNPIASGFTSGEVYTLPAPPSGTATPPLTPQTITLTSTPPLHPVLGTTYIVSATGGTSGNPVTFTVDASSTGGACSVVGDTVTFTGVGQCVIDANQAGSLTFDPAAPRSLSITIPPGRLAFVSNAAALKSPNVTFRVTCQGATACSSTVLLSAKGIGRVTSSRPVANRTGMQLGAGTTKSVVVRLSAYGRALVAQYLRAHRSLLVLDARSASASISLRVKL